VQLLELIEDPTSSSESQQTPSLRKQYVLDVRQKIQLKDHVAIYLPQFCWNDHKVES
jgi:hypothetical protein